MTWFGKILVLFNLVLSLGLMMVAVVVYTSRTDWSKEKGKDGAPDGVLLARITKANELWNQFPGAENSWRKSRDTLTVLEEGTGPEFKDGRLANREWYAAEIQFLFTGADMAKPAQEVVVDASQRPVPDDANFGRPTMGPTKDPTGNPKVYFSLAAYDKEEKGFFAALALEQKRLEDFIKEDTSLTEMLLDDPKIGKGLHRRLNEERVRFEDVKSEQELVKRPLVNTYVEAELLLKRKRQMEDRLEELQKARAAQLAGLGQK